MKVKNMVSAKGNFIANQYTIEEGNKITFQSYDSTIAIIDYSKHGAERLVIGRNWDYSKTTMKYLKMFLENWFNWENATSKAIQKAIDNKDICYNANLV